MPTTRHSLRARRFATVAMIATVAGLGLGTTAPAEAAARSESEAVVAEAERALEALDRWQETDRPVHYVGYLRARERAAVLLAADLDVPAGPLIDAWASADETKQVAMLSALTQLGVPYRSLASDPGVAFDCSGLTGWAFSEAGVELPRVSRDQIRFADEIEAEHAEAGDLAYYPGHISIYLGEQLMVHSPNSGGRVEVAAISRRARRYGDAVAADAAIPPPVAATTATTATMFID